MLFNQLCHSSTSRVWSIQSLSAVLIIFYFNLEFCWSWVEAFCHLLLFGYIFLTNPIHIIVTELLLPVCVPYLSVCDWFLGMMTSRLPCSTTSSACLEIHMLFCVWEIDPSFLWLANFISKDGFEPAFFCVEIYIFLTDFFFSFLFMFFLSCLGNLCFKQKLFHIKGALIWKVIVCSV